MNRLRSLALAAILGGVLSGCGEDQPNTPAKPADLGDNFAKDSQDKMKEANSGMNLKAAKDANKAKPSTP
jgi:hypothetical protein